MEFTTKEERDELIAEYYRLVDELKARAGASLTERRAFRAERDDVRRRYFERLPRRMLSRCPFTRTPFIHSFDPWGLDGLWWEDDAIIKTDEPAPPETFRLLLGAVNLNGLDPVGGRDLASVGPEVPYVIPRILEMPTMVAVVASLPLEIGYTAYPIAYFSQEAPAAGSLTQTWRRKTYTFTGPDGRSGWNVRNDPWDFDLEPWVESGKVWWIGAEDPNMEVRSGRWEDYPYAGAVGREEQVGVRDSELLLAPPPDGTEFEPFE